MIVAGSANPLLLASAGGYNLTRSLRFRSSASAYLNRTPSSATNQQTWTYSTWIKLGSLSLTTQQFLLNSGTGDANRTQLTIDGGLTIGFTQVAGGSVTLNLVTSAVYRDPSAWYHIVIVADTTNATASNRARIYVNGVQVTAFGSSTYWAQNTNSFINTTNAHFIGKYLNGSSNPSDWYQAETNFIDGQALTPSSFGATSTTTGVWQPKKYAGTYGTNGFYLPFTDNSALTTSSNVGLGKDFSGNGNYWNTNNISITSGATYDSMTDVPTLTSATAANFAVLNPLDKGGNITLSAANLNYSTGATNMVRATMQIPSTGKWYWECTQTSSNSEQFGIATASASTGTYLGGDANGWSYGGSGNKFNNNSSSAYGASFTNGDVIGVAFDADAGTLTFYKNNVSQGTAFSSLTGSYFPAVGGNLSSGVINFGQRPFAYTPPTGFVALNTFNLPTPTIGATASTQANKYMDVSLWTGNGSTQAVTNSGGFQPDFVWTKGRSAAYGNFVSDVLRGFDSTPSSRLLLPDSTSAELTTTPALVSSFNSNGFTVGANGNTNANGTTYVGWQWKANGTGVTNTAGSITSTVSANTTSGFSVVTWTGAGSSATIGHGLGVAPNMIFLKRRNAAVNWYVGGSNIASAGNGTWSSVLEGLNTTAAVNTGATAVFNSTAPTSTVFTGGSELTANGGTYVAYCFAEVAGFSKFGSYTGNGSSDGPMIFTGFRPRYIMIKRTDAAQSWWITDTARNPYNTCNLDLFANLSNAEENNGYNLDLLSNGVKIRTSTNDRNASGGTYIYMAFAENPFKYSLAR